MKRRFKSNYPIVPVKVIHAGLNSAETSAEEEPKVADDRELELGIYTALSNLHLGLVKHVIRNLEVFYFEWIAPLIFSICTQILFVVNEVLEVGTSEEVVSLVEKTELSCNVSCGSNSWNALVIISTEVIGKIVVL